MKTYSIPRQIWRAINLPILYILVQFLVTFIATFIFGFNYGMQQAALGNTAINQDELTISTQEFINKNTMFIMLISTIICLIIFLLTWKKESKTLDKNTNGLSLINISVIIILGIITNSLISGIIELTGIIKLFPSYEAVENLIVTGGIPLRIISIGILAPIVEELCFRGIIYNRLRKRLLLLPSIIISSILFGIVHLNLLQGIYATILGIVLALIYNKFKTIYAPIILHISFNMLTVILSLLTESNTSSESKLSSILILIACIIFTVVIVKFISKQEVIIEKQEYNEESITE